MNQNETQIRVLNTTKQKLNDIKQYRRETYNDVIERIIEENGGE